ncbi:MAG: PEP-CTERM sorting domain-containing protein, partial [Planctomycetales bacterium]|nr:PEP-CTERM sorting domain-containing protein [Planctomycetales bacterium]
DSNPDNLTSLLGIATLDNVTVDQALFDLYADEFDAFAAMDGKRLTLVPGLCDTNRDGTCDVNDIDAMTLLVIDGTATADELTGLITRPSPAGFHTYFGDANLDGEFNSGDLVVALAAGTYELGINTGWASGDFDGNGRFDSGDLVLALADGGYEQGPRAAVSAVPEPLTALLFALAATFTVLRTRRNRA